MKDFAKRQKASLTKLIMKNRVTKLVTATAIVALFFGAVWAINEAFVEDSSEEFAKVAEVTITADGFEPATLLVEPGTKVIWTNTDDELHQVAANPHPTSEELPDLKSEILNEGQTYDFIAGQSGEFGYHDYQNPTTNGTLIVVE